jgi:hypothetical protein
MMMLRMAVILMALMGSPCFASNDYLSHSTEGISAISDTDVILFETTGGVVYRIPASGIKAYTTYTLPTASTGTLGGVRVDGTTVTISSGVISAPYTYTLPTATASVLGGVKVDGTTITISGGVISGASTYTLPTATTSVLGGVKVDGTTITISSGVISAASSISIGSPLSTAMSLSSGVLNVSAFNGPGELLLLDSGGGSAYLPVSNFTAGPLTFNDGSGTIDTRGGNPIGTTNGSAPNPGDIILWNPDVDFFIPEPWCVETTSTATSGTVTFAPDDYEPDVTIYLSASSTITSLTISRPTTTRIGQIFRLVTKSAITTLTTSGGTTATANDPTSLSAGGSPAWQAITTTGSYIRLN